MRNFSIIPNSSQSVIEQYSNFLSREVYNNMQPYDLNDPLFLQQLGVLQAEGIRRAINNNSSVNYRGFQATSVTIENSANFIGNKIDSVANMLTSSLEKGFAILNNSLIKIDGDIETTNVHLSNINSGIQSVNNNLIVLGKLVGQGFSVLHNQLSQSNKQLVQILQELKIPEAQRERRYHIEEGTKYLTFALQKDDALYFDDAFEEFNIALTLEKKDWFSWFSIGLIYLRSKEHINPQKAIDAFKRTIHYGRAEIAYTKNENIEHKIDQAHLCIAESYYLQQEYKNAIEETEQCLHTKDKADFMKVKYLSATNENQNKQIAAEILSKLINKNPYITLQVLEDNDILQNEQIIKLLEKFRIEKSNEAKELLQKNFEGDGVEPIIELASTEKFLDACEAIELAKTMFEKTISEAKEALITLKREIRIKNTDIEKIEYFISIGTYSDAYRAVKLAKEILQSLHMIIERYKRIISGNMSHKSCGWDSCGSYDCYDLSELHPLLFGAKDYILDELVARDLRVESSEQGVDESNWDYIHVTRVHCSLNAEINYVRAHGLK